MGAALSLTKLSESVLGVELDSCWSAQDVKMNAEPFDLACQIELSVFSPQKSEFHKQED